LVRNHDRASRDRDQPGTARAAAKITEAVRGQLDPLAVLCVPKTSSMSCDQAVFVDQATGVSLPSDAVPVEIDRFG